ncbi:hypothetical protein JCM8547_000397 [Rhodosporidiobolus lusitaniae]
MPFSPDLLITAGSPRKPGARQQDKEIIDLTSSSPPPVPSPRLGRLHLLSLPAELLDQIFGEQSVSVEQGKGAGAFTRLRVTDADEGQLASVLSMAERLTSLRIPKYSSRSALLSSLAKPSRLTELEVATAYSYGRSSALPSTSSPFPQPAQPFPPLYHAFSTLTGLEDLNLKEYCDLSDPAMHDALRQTSLRTLTLEDGSQEVKTDDLIPLVLGPGKLLHLDSLKYMPDWPMQFGAEDLRRLVDAAEEGGVEVSGPLTSSSPPLVPSSRLRPLNLLDLPSELLDKILARLRSAKPRTGPICKVLLPFQRRQYTSLCARQATEDHLMSLLSITERLTTLAIDYSPRLPAILAVLPKPARLRELRLGGRPTSFDSSAEWRSANFFYPSTVSAPPASAQPEDTSSASSSRAKPLAAPFATLKRLTFHSIDKAFPIGDPSVHDALRQTSLDTLVIEDDGSFLKVDDLTPLVSGPAQLPDLDLVQLDFTWGGGQYGERAKHARADKPNYFYSSWKYMPAWTDNMGPEDLRRLVDIAEECGVQVAGPAIEVLEISGLRQGDGEV